jgi:hypothetical protein
VTLASAGVEPYAAGVRDLAELANRADWDFIVWGDEKMGGDVPWQAKRFVIREAFTRGAERVVWCDADVVMRKPEKLAALINADGPQGLWSMMPLSLESQFQHMVIRGENHGDFSGRAEKLHREICRGYGIAGGHLSDWFTVWNLDEGTAHRMLDVWDGVAETLRSNRLTWADGMSIAIAAEVVGVPVIYRPRPFVLLRTITHLHHSGRHGLYVLKGEHKS